MMMLNVQQWGNEKKNAIKKYFAGNDSIIDTVLAAYLCNGHVLIEDLPGTGKTIFAQALSLAVGGTFRQVSCTPDLFPSDILGVSIYQENTEKFVFRPGPIMGNFIVFDEINRATPRTQSALLEVMAEKQVSVEGHTLPLPNPFFIIATESPVDSEGTFPLPEVQKDRFFITVSLGYPSEEDEKKILRNELAAVPVKHPEKDSDDPALFRDEIQNVYISPGLKNYLLELVAQSREDKRLVIGISPRGSLALFKGCQALAALNGRDYITPEDIKEMAFPVLRKRIIINPAKKAEGLTEDSVIREYVESLEVPLENRSSK